MVVMAQKKTISLQMLALADQVISADDGKKSIIGIFDKIFVRALPANHPRMVLFITLLGKVDESDVVQLQFVAPSGAELDTKELKFQFGENGRANIIVNLEGFPIQEVGQYLMSISHGELELGSYAFDVIRVEEKTEQRLVG
jgi:hypothetical protein